MLNSPDGLRLSGEELNMVKLLLENCIHLLRDSYSDNVNVRHRMTLSFHGSSLFTCIY